jgi:hypothetical protein
VLPALDPDKVFDDVRHGVADGQLRNTLRPVERVQRDRAQRPDVSAPLRSTEQ